jgi:hypothetical protein
VIPNEQNKAGRRVTMSNSVGQSIGEKDKNGVEIYRTKRGYGWDANPWVWVIKFKRVEV